MNTLCKPITRIYNLSIKLASFPDKCKVAKIKPLYKKSLKTNPKTVTPISLLLVIFKIIARIIHDQTMNFLSDNNVLYKYQSGFRKFQQTIVCHTSMTKSQKVSIRISFLELFLLIYKRRSIQLTTTF